MLASVDDVSRCVMTTQTARKSTRTSGAGVEELDSKPPPNGLQEGSWGGSTSVSI